MTSGEITRLLAAAAENGPGAADRLYAVVYDELRQLARSVLRREFGPRTLQPTALVNEAYLRLGGGAAGFENRRHFFGAAARAMRRILVDEARQREADKRGGALERVPLTGLEIPALEADPNLIAIDDALGRLAEVEPRLAAVVDLRYFAGLSIEETAEAIGCSPATVKRDWIYARAWLVEQIGAGE